MVLFRARLMAKECARVMDTESIVRVEGTFADLTVPTTVLRRPCRETGKRRMPHSIQTMITVNSSSTDKTILVADRGKELANFRAVTANNKAYFYEREDCFFSY